MVASSTLQRSFCVGRPAGVWPWRCVEGRPADHQRLPTETMALSAGTCIRLVDVLVYCTDTGITVFTITLRFLFPPFSFLLILS